MGNVKHQSLILAVFNFNFTDETRWCTMSALSEPQSEIQQAILRKGHLHENFCANVALTPNPKPEARVSETRNPTTRGKNHS